MPSNTIKQSNVSRTFTSNSLGDFVALARWIAIRFNGERSENGIVCNRVGPHRPPRPTGSDPLCRSAAQSPTTRIPSLVHDDRTLKGRATRTHHNVADHEEGYASPPDASVQQVLQFIRPLVEGRHREHLRPRARRGSTPGQTRNGPEPAKPVTVKSAVEKSPKVDGSASP